MSDEPAAEPSWEDGRLLYERGTVLLRKRRYEEAVTALAASNRLAPDHPVTLLNLGKALAGAGRTEEAITGLSRAIALNPRGMGALLSRGRCYERLGMREAAARGFEAALEIEPGAARVRRALEAIRDRDASHPPNREGVR